MIPQHDSFYDVFSRAAKLDIRWPGDARIAVALAGNLEAWTETPDPKLRRSRHVGGSNPLTGSATWTGAMAGVTVGGSDLGVEVTGDAKMTANLGAASPGLAFTNIADRSGARSNDIRWHASR